MPFKRIVVGMSGGGKEHAKANLAIEIKKLHDAELTFVHVNNPLHGTGGLVGGDHGLAYTDEEFRHYVDEQSSHNLSEADHTIVYEGWNVDTVAEIGKNYDLLILGHTHQSMIAEMFSDTTDQRIINKVSIPVLVIPKELG